MEMQDESHEHDIFAEVRKHNGSAHPQKARLCVVLLAIEEIIRERKGGNPTAIDYFGAFMTSLEGADLESAEDVVGLLTLTLPHVPAAPLQARFRLIIAIFVRLVRDVHSGGSGHTALLKHVLECIQVVLKVQGCLQLESREGRIDTGALANPAIVQAVDILLTHFDDSRSKVRRTAAEATLSLLTEFPRSLGPQVSAFAKQMLEKAAKSQGSMLHFLGFLHKVVSCLPPVDVEAMAPLILNYVHCGDLTLEWHAAKVLCAWVDQHSSSHTLGSISSCLVSNPLRLTSITEHHIHWIRLLGSSSQSQANSTAAIALLVQLCECHLPSILKETSSSLTRIIRASELTSLALSSLFELFDFRFSASWAHSLPVLAELAQISSVEISNKILNELVGLHEQLVLSGNEDMCCVVEQSFAQASKFLGPQRVLNAINLSRKTNNTLTLIVDERTWILPLLKSEAPKVPCELAHFESFVLNMAKLFDGIRHESLVSEPRKAQNARLRIAQLWSLLPAYCASCNDAQSALPTLGSVLVNAVKDNRYPELQPIVCKSLNVLASRTTRTDLAIPFGDPTVLVETSKEVVPVLFKLLTSTQQGAVILETMTSLATLLPERARALLFKKSIEKLLITTTSQQDFNAAMMMCDLCVALVPSLNAEQVAKLFQVIKPTVTLDRSPNLQKKAYKVLLAVSEQKGDLVLSSEYVQEVMDILALSLNTCHVASRLMRLRCIECLVQHFDRSNVNHIQLIPNLLGEVMLCTKDSNAKTREAAYDTLVALGRCMNDSQELVKIIMAALAGHTAHMRSAAVLSLSRVFYEFSRDDEELRALGPEVLQTALILTKQKQKEVLKAVLSLTRVIVAISNPESLEPILPDIVNGVMCWSGDSRHRFRAMVKVIFKKLCRMFGFEAISQLLPSNDKALITYLQRMAARKERKRKQGTFNELVESDFEDSDDEGHTGHTESSELVVTEKAGSILNLLDSSSLMSNVGRKRDLRAAAEDESPEYTFAKDGRVIIGEDPPAELAAPSVKKRRREGPESQAQPHASKQKRTKRQPTAKPGQEYKSKKAGGDVKKKGMLEPYAYIPLDPKLLSKKQGHQALDQFSSVVRNENSKGRKNKQRRGGGRKK